jgi:hypothetical protein
LVDSKATCSIHFLNPYPIFRVGFLTGISKNRDYQLFDLRPGPSSLIEDTEAEVPTFEQNAPGM